MRAWTREAGAAYAELRSSHGHDGFLLEADSAGAILAGALAGGGAGEISSRAGAAGAARASSSWAGAR